MQPYLVRPAALKRGLDQRIPDQLLLDCVSGAGGAAIGRDSRCLSRGSRAIGASITPDGERGLPSTSVTYSLSISRLAICFDRASCATRFFATTIRPLVSLSSLWTMPGRASSPMSRSISGTWARRALTSVPPLWPGAGCTTIPAGLSTTRRSASSSTTLSGMASATRPLGWGALSQSRRGRQLSVCERA